MRHFDTAVLALVIFAGSGFLSQKAYGDSKINTCAKILAFPRVSLPEKEKQDFSQWDTQEWVSAIDPDESKFSLIIFNAFMKLDKTDPEKVEMVLKEISYYRSDGNLILKNIRSNMTIRQTRWFENKIQKLGLSGVVDDEPVSNLKAIDFNLHANSVIDQFEDENIIVTEKDLEMGFESPNPKVRRAVFSRLVKNLDSPRALDLFVRAFSDNDRQIRDGSVEVLSLMNDRHILELLIWYPNIFFTRRCPNEIASVIGKIIYSSEYFRVPEIISKEILSGNRILMEWGMTTLYLLSDQEGAKKIVADILKDKNLRRFAFRLVDDSPWGVWLGKALKDQQVIPINSTEPQTH